VKVKAMLLALGLVVGISAGVYSSGMSIEAFRAANEAAFNDSGAIPLKLVGAAASLKCSTRIRFNYGGQHGRCPYGRVVTGVQMTGDLAILTCGEVEVTCR
jgi:hypothetical protein